MIEYEAYNSDIVTTRSKSVDPMNKYKKILKSQLNNTSIPDQIIDH
jgi:hypothetical protein